MRIRGKYRAIPALLTLLAAIILTAPDAASQQERSRPSRRITNPVRQSRPLPAPTPARGSQTDATVVSTADATDEERGAAPPPRQTSRRRASRTTAAQADEETQLRRTVTGLSEQVTRLAEDLNELRDQQRTLVNLERLSRAEQRAEGFRAQLREVMDKEIGLQARLEQIDYELQPESIERRAALMGTLRPAELREQIRQQLESEKRRVQEQLNLYTTSRARLEAAIATADSEVERLRARVEAEDRIQAQAGTDAEGTRRNPNTTTTTQTVEPLPIEPELNTPPEDIP